MGVLKEIAKVIETHPLETVTGLAFGAALGVLLEKYGNKSKCDKTNNLDAYAKKNYKKGTVPTVGISRNYNKVIIR